MNCAAAISHHPIPSIAVGEAAGEILDKAGTGADVLLMFVSAGFAGALEDIADAVQRLLEPKTMIGCIGDGVVGTGTEVVGDDALSIWVGSGFKTSSFVTDLAEDESLLANALPSAAEAITILLADPRTYSVETLFDETNKREQPPEIVGGYAHESHNLLPNQLVHNGKVIDGGAVGVTIERKNVDCAVAQGARPIGSPLVVTKADGRIIHGLAGESALKRLTEMMKAELKDDDLALVGEGLLLGRVVDEHLEQFAVGDFLVRTVLDSDPLSGSLTVSDHFPVGSIVQFHVRDPITANIALLRQLGGADAAGVLLFGSKERGYKLFDEPSHDAQAIADRMDNPPTAGFMGPGEFGRVAELNAVNGLSASLLIFRS